MGIIIYYLVIIFIGVMLYRINKQCKHEKVEIVDIVTEGNKTIVIKRCKQCNETFASLITQDIKD